MFAMVLAIGLLVDDAIVVVENVERVMSEDGLPPKEATSKINGPDHWRAGRYCTGALGRIRADGLFRRLDRGHLSSVLDHTGFVDDPVRRGRHRPDSALCATIMKPIAKGHHASDRGFFGWFNKVFDSNTQRYQGIVGRMLGKRRRAISSFTAQSSS